MYVMYICDVGDVILKYTPIRASKHHNEKNIINTPNIICLYIYMMNHDVLLVSQPNRR